MCNILQLTGRRALEIIQKSSHNYCWGGFCRALRQILQQNNTGFFESVTENDKLLLVHHLLPFFQRKQNKTQNKQNTTGIYIAATTNHKQLILCNSLTHCYHFPSVTTKIIHLPSNQNTPVCLAVYSHRAIHGELPAMFCSPLFASSIFCHLYWHASLWRWRAAFCCVFFHFFESPHLFFCAIMFFSLNGFYFTQKRNNVRSTTSTAASDTMIHCLFLSFFCCRKMAGCIYIFISVLFFSNYCLTLWSVLKQSCPTHIYLNSTESSSATEMDIDTVKFAQLSGVSRGPAQCSTAVAAWA